MTRPQDIPGSDDAPESTADFALQDMVEFADNPEPRCPCVIVLNNCDWQSAESLAALNKGIQTFKRELENDPLASLRVEPAIVMYGWGEADIYEDFKTVDEFNPGALESLYGGWGGRKGAGPIGMALDMIEDRKSRYRASGIGYYRPWMLHIAACGACVGWSSIQSDWQRLTERDKKVAFFAVCGWTRQGITRAGPNPRAIAPERTRLRRTVPLALVIHEPGFELQAGR